MSHNFCDRRSTWVSVSIPKYIYRYFCNYYYVEKLLRAFRYYCSFCVSPRSYNSSIKLLASVTVSV